MQVTLLPTSAKPTNATKNNHDCHISHNRIWHHGMVQSYLAAWEVAAYPSVNQEGKDPDPCLINAPFSAESAPLSALLSSPPSKAKLTPDTLPFKVLVPLLSAATALLALLTLCFNALFSELVLDTEDIVLITALTATVPAGLLLLLGPPSRLTPASLSCIEGLFAVCISSGDAPARCDEYSSVPVSGVKAWSIVNLTELALRLRGESKAGG
jgi:hypothetical protein